MTASTLTLTAFLALAETCGAGIAPQTLADLTRAESRFDTLAINVNGSGGGTVRGIDSKRTAIAKARALIRQGRNFDAGVAQINSRNWEWLGLTVETVFDPCANIGAQARLLKSFSKYNTGDEFRGFANGYVRRVVDTSRAAANVSAATSAPVSRETPTPSPSACGTPPPSWDAFGTARHMVACLSRRSKPVTIVVEEYP